MKSLSSVCICLSPCQTRHTVGSVTLWSITSSLCGNFTSFAFTSLSNELPIMMSPTAIKLVLSCLWYCNASVSTNMFSVCRNLMALKPINLRWIVATKCASTKPLRVVRLPWQTPAASRLFEGAGQPGRHKLTMAIQSFWHKDQLCHDKMIKI